MSIQNIRANIVSAELDRLTRIIAFVGLNLISTDLVRTNEVAEVRLQLCISWRHSYGAWNVSLW